MDIIFDIDGTIADASHRLHYIKDMARWEFRDGKPPRPNWEMFLSDEQISLDAPIVPMFKTMEALYNQGCDIFFCTGRNETTRKATTDWILQHAEVHAFRVFYVDTPKVFMRSKNDRRPSDVVKRDLLAQVRATGADPVMAFEDRKEDTAMWRSEGLLCCQVAEGFY